MKINGIATMILVQDMDRALRFYRDTLGFTVAGEQEDWVVFDEGVGLLLSPEPMPADALNCNALMLSIRVDDVRSVYDELVKAGVAFFLPPTDIGGAWTASMRDSEGNIIQLVDASA